MGIVKGLAYGALLALLGLIVAVAVATAYLPSYGDLTKRSDLGQMIRSAPPTARCWCRWVRASASG